MSAPSSHRSLLGRWALFSHRHPLPIVGAWLVILVSVTLTNQAIGGRFIDSFEIPGTEAQQAIDVLEAEFPSEAGGSADVVFRAQGGVESPANAARINQVLDHMAALEDVSRVEHPFRGSPGYVSSDGIIARAVVHFTHSPGEVPASTIEEFFAIADSATAEGFTVELGGPIVNAGEEELPGTEAFGVLFAIIVLLFAFGSLVAAGLPIGAAIFGVGTGFGIVGLAANFGAFPSIAPQFAAMIGIGVGIDYSLLVVTRFREGLHAGRPVDDALAAAMATAGRSVIFAGVVVAVSFLGLAFMGVPFVTAMGITGAIVVSMAVLVAITLMPAVLSLAGTRVDRLRLPGIRSREGIDQSGIWWRLSNAIQRRPRPYFAASLGFVLVLSSPVLAIDLGITDDGNKGTETRSRRAYDLLAEGFGPGFNGPLLMVITGPSAQATGQQLAAAAVDVEGVQQVSQPIAAPGGNAAILTVIPTTSPQDDATADLIHTFREDVIPVVAEPGAETSILVSGNAAAFVDLGERISKRLPFLFIGVIGISFLLLTAVFRSVLVALKAAILNLLSISAAFGVLVAIFQWGWGAGIIGIQPGPIETFAPMMLFAVLFGLSMDYEVFLISRIREEYVKSGNTAEAVSHGLAATARVITAAAAIMIFVFLGFVLGSDRVIKEFGLGLATAIFVDATIVRLILVPSTMELLGKANWWLPGWLDRILPHIDLEGETEPPMEAGAPAGGR